MKVTKIIAVLVALVAIVPASAFLLVQPVSAHEVEAVDDSTTPTTDRETRIQELKDATVARRCSILTNNIDRLIANYGSKHDGQVERYKNIAQKVKDEVDRLDNLGYDVTNLRTALQKLNAEIVEFSNLRADFQAKLVETRSLACGDSEGAYKALVEDARSTLRDMKAKAQEISATLKNEVRPAVKAVLQQRQN